MGGIRVIERGSELAGVGLGWAELGRNVARNVAVATARPDDVYE